jgi:hypothetical protein
MPCIKLGDRLIETDAMIAAEWHADPGQPLHLRVMLDGGHVVDVRGPEAGTLRDWLLAHREYRDLTPPAVAPEAAPAVPEGETAFDTWQRITYGIPVGATREPAPPQQQNQGDPVPPVKFREFT